MNRREVVLGLGLAVVTLVASSALGRATAAKEATVTLEISGMV